jgi:hypothetical protein
VDTAVTKQVEVQYKAWDGSNFDAIRALVGDAAKLTKEGLQVQRADGRWMDVFEGWVVHTGLSDGVIGVSAADSWARFFQAS